MSKEEETGTFRYIDESDDVAYVSVKLDNEDNKSLPNAQEQEQETKEDKGIIDTILQNHPKFRYPPSTCADFCEQIGDIIKYYPEINEITPLSERFLTQIQFLRILYKYIYTTPFYLIKHKVQIVISVSNNCIRLLKEIPPMLEKCSASLTLEQQEEVEVVRTLLMEVWHKYNTRTHRFNYDLL